MRIAYVANERSANGFYRAFAPMTALGYGRELDVRRIPEGEPRWVPGCDVLHIHRHTYESIYTLARQAKEEGAAVVWDNDDDQGAMPKSVVTYKYFGGLSGERRRVEIQRLFRLTDLVTAPSVTLAERFAALGAPRVEVVENFIPDQLLDVSRPPHDGVTIGWIAGLEHQMDVERLPIRAVLQRLLDERADVRVTTIGLRLGLTSDRYDAMEPVRTTDVSRYAAQFDIAIAPLADIDFGRSRSNVKLKEYAAAGTPWLASPIGPYAGMGERQGGRLVADERWHEELTRLIEKPRERRKLGKRARKWVQGETLSANLEAIEGVLRRAVEHARSAAAVTCT
jgi:glycosyltransferase involved in cell wall biosynthesis